MAGSRFGNLFNFSAFRDFRGSLFGDEDIWKKGWDTAHAKWNELGAKSIEPHIAPGQPHSFFNKKPSRTITLIEADKFLVKHGFLRGEPTLKASASGEKLVAAPWRRPRLQQTAAP